MASTPTKDATRKRARPSQADHARGAAQGAAQGALPSPASELQERIRAWYLAVARDLPWRRTRDPYAIWLSEVMLQQTRVDTVLPYYGRFLARFPSVRALAEAPEPEVLAAWSGLGYYRRARMLHAAAQAIADRASFPGSRDALLAVPGIGPYTAAAVASIAFGEPVELVDGNVARVLSRLFAFEGDVRSTAGLRRIWELAKQVLDRHDPATWNQALMELGATVCLPRKPRCSGCPASQLCVARERGVAELLPRARAKARPSPEPRVALVARVGTRVLLGRRCSELRFGGLWEPPSLEGDLVEEEAVSARFEELLGSPLRALAPAGRVVHVLSHRRLEVAVYSAELPSVPEGVARGDYAAFAAFEADALARLGTSTFARKLLALCPGDRP